MRTGWGIVVVVVLAFAAIAWSDARLKVPDLFGKTQDEANELLKNAGFMFDATSSAVGCKGPVPTGKPDENRIKCQEPQAGALVDKHTMIQVELYEIPQHPERISTSVLGSLINLPIDEAKQKLHDLGYRGVIKLGTYRGARPCKRGAVCDVEPFKDITLTSDLTFLVMDAH